MVVEVNGFNVVGDNIGGFENEFYCFLIILVNEWGGIEKLFNIGEIVEV